MNGVSPRQELADSSIPQRIHIPALRDDAELVTRLFAPLGWQVDAARLAAAITAPASRDRVAQILRQLGVIG